MVEVRVLGGLEVRAAGAPLPLPADARARELLAWLALNPGRHARSTLAGRLRPDVTEESARKTLRDAVYRLRSALGPGGDMALEATREHVGLVDVRIDMQEFRRLRVAGELEAAVAVAAGELLTGMDADWVLQAREQHASELAACVAMLAEQAEAAGDLGEALAWTRRRLEIEPLAEVAHRELVRLLALADDRPAALAAASSLTDRLRRELGVPPSAATRTLIEDVRRGRVGAGVAAADAAVARPSLPAPLARTARPEGRHPALARLETAWTDAASSRTPSVDAAVAGTLRLALVAGEPGIGKTTLAGELARRVHAQGAAVLYGRCDERALIPYQPWVQALEGHLTELADADVEHWLAAHDGALARLLPARSAGSVRAGDARERYLAFETVRALLEESSARQPLLVVLDDLHWADEDSLTLLCHLARTALRARALIVMCARDAELSVKASEALGDLRREGPLAEIALGGLDEEAISALLAQRGGATDRESARRYRRRTGGNPFFLDALLRDEHERGEQPAAPPQGVRDVVARRLTRLELGTRDALALAATVGLEFDLDTIAGADGRAVTELHEALDGAAEAGLITPAGAPGRYAFAHALVGETIACSLSASRRARLHLQVADALVERKRARGGIAAGEIAVHLRAAAPLAEAKRLAGWELAAAREATAALGHAEAAAHYDAALATLPDSPDRAELLIALGHARDRAGERALARAAFFDAAALARARGDAELLARAALGYGGLATVIAAADPQATALLEEALASAPRESRATAARLRARLAVELYYADPGRALELSARAVADAGRIGDAATLAATLNARRVALWSPAHADARLGLADDMIAAAEAAGDSEAVLQGRNWRVVDLLELGRVQETTAEIDTYEALADELGLPHFRWYVPLWRAGLAMLAGRWSQARRLAEQALTLGRQADDPNAPLLVRIQHGHALDAQRRIAELDRAWYAEMAASSPVSAAWAVSLSVIDAQTGHIDQARRLVAELARDGCSAFPMDANWHTACDLADAAALVGDRDAAASLHAMLAPHANLFPVIARAIACYGSTEYYVGRLAAVLGRHDEAQARLRRAVTENERVGAEPRVALALLRLGEVLTARSQRDQARDTLTDAIARAEAAQMPALAAEAHAALQQLDR
jgi:DNA-binding SARP family transcriptional activator